MTFRLRIWVAWLAVISAPLLTAAAPALADTRSDWAAFRRQFPYHAQVIALGRPAPDGRRTIVISEPPPSTTLEAVISAYRGRIRDATTARQRIGFDGWVMDIVGVVPPGDDATVQALVEDLSRDLFGTSYKAYAVDISDPPVASGEYDLSVSSLALREWLGVQPAARSDMTSGIHTTIWVIGFVTTLVLLRKRTRRVFLVWCTVIVIGYATREVTPRGPAGDLRPLHGGDTVSLKTALENPSPGVYMTDTPGLMVLLMRRDRPLNDLTVPLREFALDSDLVLGAIGSRSAVAVVARERQTPVTTMPPLRTETVLQLAAADTDELSQSYERRNLFAGKIRDINRDWAPIFLSPHLRDTEYGSLLNITDQMLKGWSEHGRIEYINFPYPKPHTFPFDEGLLAAAKTNLVTYNWNTKGVGYTDNAGGYDVVAFGRTGALPVDYLGERDNRMRAFEDRGYDYFAGVTGDPNLARVVQYAGLYQVWRHFDIKATWQRSTRSHDGPEALVPMVVRALEAVRDYDDAAIARMVEGEIDPFFKEQAEKFKEIHTTLGVISRTGNDGFEQLARALVRPRETMQQLSMSQGQEAVLGLAQAISRNEVVRMVLRRGNGTAAKLYSTADSKDEPDSWIKTPSIVLSWQSGEGEQGEGGHSLSSRITRTVIDDSLTPGSVRVAEEGGQRVLYYHSSDATKMRGAVRAFGRSTETEPAELTRTVEAALRQAKSDSVTMTEALHLRVRPATLARGFNASAGVRGAKVVPWRRAGDIPSAHVKAISALKEPTVYPMVVERTPSGRYLISRGDDIHVIEAGDGAGVMDVIHDAVGQDHTARALHLHFKGMNEQQARAFAQAGEFHGVNGGGKKINVRTSVEGSRGDGIAVIGEIRGGKWDVARADVKVVEQAVQDAGSVHLDVTIPEKLSPRTLRMRVEVELRNGMRATTEFIQRLSAVIRDVLHSMMATGQDIDMLVASQRIKQAMRLQDESLANVKMRIHTQAGEIDVVRNVLAPAPGLAE